MTMPEQPQDDSEEIDKSTTTFTSFLTEDESLVDEQSEIDDTPSLQRLCDDFTNAFVSGADEATLIKMKDFAERLKGTKIAEQAHRVPQNAPDFELPDQYGNNVRMSDLLKEHTAVVISFYRGSWCPYCSLEMKALNSLYRKLQKRGAILIAVSPMLLEKTQLMAEEYSKEDNTIQFPVLSDEQNVVAKKYGLVFTVDKMLHGMYKSWGFDVPAFNGDETWELPIPATYIVVPPRRIHFAMVDTDYSRRAEPKDILKALKSANKPVGMGSNAEEDKAERRRKREARRKRNEEKARQLEAAGKGKVKNKLGFVGGIFRQVTSKPNLNPNAA